MIRSSTKELLTPFKELKQVLRSARKLFKTTSLVYSSSPEFDLFFDCKDQSEEEVAEIDEKAHFELKGQFLKELHDNTFSGADNEDANKHIVKGLEIVDLFHIPDVTQDMQEVILFYKGLDVPTRQILDSKDAIPTMKVADAKKAIKDMADHSKK
ncbi:hypothetical protein Tco_0039180 [Tanacetum coccineum]